MENLSADGDANDMEANAKVINSSDEKTTPNTLKKEDSDKKETYWCSWCFEEHIQELMQKHLLTRNVYKCLGCKNVTLHCIMCKIGMSRKFPTYDDKMCAVCDDTIEKWGDMPPPEKETLQGYCSWCFKNGTHKLHQKNYITRNIYQCQECGKRTVPCKKCKEALARGSEGYDDYSCSKCDGTIADWDTVQEDDIKTVAWCSWCFERATHKLERKNAIRRSVYNCENCNLKTLKCSSCKEGMTRGGPAWDDTYCAICFATNKERTWENVKEKKDTIVGQQRDRERVIAELKRDSKYRQKARKEGMLRPFLLMVAMPASFRNQIACCLGWTVFTEDYFGDPHAEAWDIISSSRAGMQSRCSKSYEKLNVFASSCNWYDILVRVAKCGFQKDISKKVPWKETLMHCSDPNTTFIPQLEEELLLEVAHMTEAQMTEQQKKQLKEDMTGINGETLTNLFVQKASVTQGDVLRYAFDITKQVFSITNRTGLLVTTQSTALLSFSPALATSLGAVTAQLATLATPLFVLGIVGLTAQSLQLAFGSSEGRLVIPTVLILNQRLLLAVENIKIEDYYEVIHEH